MANASSSQQILASFDPNSGTMNTTYASSYLSSETDYAMYYKVALVLFCTLMSGVVALASAIRSLAQAQAVREPRYGTHCTNTQDVEAQRSPSPFREEEPRETSSEVGCPGKAPTTPAIDQLDGGNTLRLPYPPPAQQSSERGPRVLKRLQAATFNSAFITNAVNAIAVTASSVFGGSPSIQLNLLPTPVTDPRTTT